LFYLNPKLLAPHGQNGQKAYKITGFALDSHPQTNWLPVTFSFQHMLCIITPYHVISTNW